MDGEQKVEISALKIIQNNLNLLGKSIVIQRIAICGLILPKKETEVATFFAKFSKTTQSDPSAILSGLLILRANSWIHVFEATSAMMSKILIEITTASVFAGSTVKVLYLNEDIDARAFPVWMFKLVETRNGKEIINEKLFEESNVGEVISSICTSLIGIGGHLMQAVAVELKTTLAGVAEKYRDSIPSGDMIVEITSCEHVLDVSEYVSFFHSQPHVKLDSGKFKIYPSSNNELEYSWPVSQLQV